MLLRGLKATTNFRDNGVAVAGALAAAAVAVDDIAFLNLVFCGGFASREKSKQEQTSKKPLSL